ncbi:Twin-arginine translocation pathway signal [Vibrio sp. S4M6]|uniref:DUF6931 family protein n=1 Tax=Vibrio sinus TaxID=2946865 RepID=UPI002029DBEB|nr:Twin-arginine translocation pathway signal [Vibrio sinus]MCL9781219.1 Twin-arginine translocation pathway signal [Vibrio sinus]
MTLRKIPYQQASQILDLYSANASFSQLCEENIAPLALIEHGIKKAMFSDVVIFLAHAIPVRESVWWAACCAATRNDWNEDEANAVRAAKAWVHTPDETSRRYAERMASIAGLESGAGWAAQAAFWSGGSMTKPEDPLTPPPPHLYAQAAAGCITLTAVLPDGSEAEKRYQGFLEIGLNIAHGGNGQD